METLPTITIKDKIHILRNTEVMLDSDLAVLYGVKTKRINEAVMRNPEKFPEDFMFSLTDDELDILRSQFATTKYSMTRSNPKAFTEQGVYMLATILKSQTATEVTISIMRTFTKLRHYALEHTDLSAQISKIRREVTQNKEWTKNRMSAVADAIIMLEESFDDLKEMVSEIGAAKEVEAIGFLRGNTKE